MEYCRLNFTYSTNEYAAVAGTLSSGKMSRTTSTERTTLDTLSWPVSGALTATEYAS